MKHNIYKRKPLWQYTWNGRMLPMVPCTVYEAGLTSPSHAPLFSCNMLSSQNSIASTKFSLHTWEGFFFCRALTYNTLRDFSIRISRSRLYFWQFQHSLSKLVFDDPSTFYLKDGSRGLGTKGQQVASSLWLRMNTGVR